MNREILFRGKIKNIDELIGKGFLTDGAVNSISKWVYGVPIPRYPDLFLAWSEGNGEYEEITIIPKSITQHTGLTDKNGVKIFEGDVLEGDLYDILDPGAKWRSEVVWGKFGWMCKDRQTLPMDEYDIREGEVIGNIYDNPELMEAIK